MTRAACGEYEIDDDPARIDVAAATDFLTTQAYWGRWRDPGTIAMQIAAAWRLVGAYDQAGNMVGLARAFSDGGTAYLADVYVLPAHRGAGLAKAIVRLIIDDGPGTGQRWMLHTSDAHGLYRQFGFTAPDGRYLERPASLGNGTAAAAADRRAPGWDQPLTGQHVRLEPLGYQHVPGLAAAAAVDPSLYAWTTVPQGEPGMRDYVTTALRARDDGTAAPFAVIRPGDGAVAGCTRLWDLEYWPWPPGHQWHGRRGPDVCEIGHTWLSAPAIRTAVNTEAKLLLLTLAFDGWQAHRVCFHTDARNERSNAALRRIGASYEGTLRAHRMAADCTLRDSARYSIMATQWPAVRERLSQKVRERISQQAASP